MRTRCLGALGTCLQDILKGSELEMQPQKGGHGWHAVANGPRFEPRVRYEYPEEKELG